MSIRLRLALLFTASALALLLGGGVIFLVQLNSGLQQSLTLTLTTRADTLQSELTDTPGAISQEYLREYHLQSSVNGTYAQVLTPDGRLIDTARLIPDEPLITPQQAALALRRTVLVNRTVRLSDAGGSTNQDMRVLARRLSPSGDVLAVGIRRDVAEQAVSRTRTQYIWLGLGVLLLAGPGAWLLTTSALKPVERMRREVQALRSRPSDTTLRVPGTRDEIARLAETFNVLLAELAATLAREKALVADAGHELRTPLTVLKGELELARRPHRSREELAHTVDVAAVETDRLVRLTDDLLFLSGEEAEGLRAIPFRDFDLTALGAQAVGAIAARTSDVHFLVDAPGPVYCRGNSDWIRRALDNLLANAARFSPRHSTITVRISTDDGQHRLAVIDEGPGFPPEFIARAFDRFSRADDSREREAADEADAGTGLGLAIVSSIATRHRGQATARNRPDGGAEVMLLWPSSEADHSSQRQA